MLKREYAHSININLLLLASINIARFLNNLRSCKDDFGALVFHESQIRPTCRNVANSRVHSRVHVT